LLSYVIAGLVLGGIYALCASGLVLTYVSAGVLNLAFGALAFLIARLYYWLEVQRNWSTWQAGLVAILLAGPILGFALWAILFRHMQQASQLTKFAVTIGLSITVPAIVAIIFGTQPILTSPGLAPQPVRIFHVDGTPVSLDQLITYGCVIAVLALGIVVLRYTRIGLRVRATVDSPSMTAISGTNPSIVAAGAWAVSIGVAGLAGVLASPVIGLSIDSYIAMMSIAFAAVIAARLRSMSVAVAVGFLIGVVTALCQWLLPPASGLTADVLPSIPFIFILIALAFFSLNPRWLVEHTRHQHVLDAALGHPEQEGRSPRPTPAKGEATGAFGFRRVRGHGLTALRFLDGPPLALAATAVLILVLHGPLWAGLPGLGIAYAVAFLPLTLVTGEGGMIWLCQITLVGIGAIAAAQLSTVFGLPVLLSILIAGVVAAIVGAALSALTMRLGNVYLALATLTFAILIEQLIYPIQRFYQFGAGVNIGLPEFATSNLAWTFLTLAIFAVLCIFLASLRRSTTGLALSSLRGSEIGTAAVGLSVVRIKLFISTLAAFISGIGGGLLACYAGAAVPDSYDAITGLIWFAVVVTIGIRSSTGALVAGLSLAFVPAIFTSFLPASYAEIPTVLFGLGAILASRSPDGILAAQRLRMSLIRSKFQSALQRQAT
jgi:branched-chain amino acid transport system permease protein